MRRSSTRIASLLALCLIASAHAQVQLAQSLAPEAGPFAQPGTIKIRVPHESFKPAMGRVVHDYGAFVVLEAKAGAIPASPDIEILDRENLVLLNTGSLDTTLPAIKQLRQPRPAFQGRSMHLIQFAGPIARDWYDALVKTGVEIVTYIPSNTYLVYGDAAAIAAVQNLGAADASVQWDGEYLPAYRIDPAAAAMMKDPSKANAKDTLFSIQLVKDDATNKQTLAVVDAARTGATLNEWELLNYHNIIVPLSPITLEAIAAQPDVVSIQPYSIPVKFDERADQIIAGNLTGNVPSGPGYLAWLGTKGFTQAQFTASNFIVDVSDSGLDNGTTNPNHFGLFTGGVFASGSRVAYSRLVGSANAGSTLHGCDGHGNLNAHIIGGYDNTGGTPFADASGYHYGLGVCPFVKLGASVIFDPNTFTSPSYPTLQSQAYASGARISSNSWGNTTGNTYTSESQTYDSLVRDAQSGTAGNQEMVIVFAAGNSGSSTTAMHAPGNAKNVITVGAGENVQAFGGSDASGVADSGANSANDIISFSSRGPTGDNRKKPDICAPGTHYSGGVAQASQVATGTGAADACFNGSGVSGGVSSNFFPSAGQQFYTASSGTSHSTPCVSGGCALVRQYFINQGMAAPSPAMTKAVLMNSARYMTGTGAADNLWSINQGMGEMNLGETFKYGTTTPTIFRDEVAADLFSATGQTRVFTGSINNNALPFRITLAWTDAPGATTGAASKNNLDLTVTVGANTYKGNVFSTSASTTGGAADALNNVESVFLPAGTTGTYTVTITATNINSDGVPGNADTTDQDFALVIYNGGSGCAAPTVSGNAGSFVACVGSPISFSVSASGTSLTYQWRKDTINISGANATSYSITSLIAGDAGSYDCVIGSACGSITSSAASLAVNPATAISANPAPTQGCVGGSASFTVGGTGANLSYQWRRAGTPILGATASTLTINPITAGDVTNFDCVVTGDCGSATSAAAALSLMPGPVITASPTPTRACVGGVATFSVSATGAGVGGGPLTYQWRKNGVPIGGATSPSCTINPVTLASQASYSCAVTGACSSSFSNVASLAVDEPASIPPGSQPASQTVCAGAGVTLTTIVNGSADTLQWRRNTIPIAGAIDSQLVIPAATTADSGTYDCVIIGPCNTLTTDPAVITVNPPTAITTNPQPQTACVGGTATFSVVAAGVSNTYQWRRGGNPVGGATAATLTISPVTSGDAAAYDCVVTGACGTATSTAAALTLTAATTISGNPTPQTVCDGASASFSVSATGDTLTYQWRKGGIPIGGATTTTLTVNPVSLASASSGLYDCVVTGTCGVATSAAATLTVTPATAITTNPDSHSACAGGSVTFTTFASGSGLTYQWRKDTHAIPGATSSFLTINPVAASDAGSYDCVVTGACGNATTTAASLTVGDALLITANPSAQSVCTGGPVALTVAVTGTSPTYQWRKDTIDIGGATAPTLSINAAAATDIGSYDCVITGACGSVTSAAALVGVCSATAITTSPSPTLSCPGGSATFTVAATGDALMYQWRKGGNPIPGATGPSLTINPVANADNGLYDCVVTNCCDTSTSAAARLNVCAADFNCNGSLQIQDIFDFLGAWFNGNPAADFNGGGLAIQDIFDFLSAWFAGCS